MPLVWHEARSWLRGGHDNQEWQVHTMHHQTWLPTCRSSKQRVACTRTALALATQCASWQRRRQQRQGALPLKMRAARAAWAPFVEYYGSDSLMCVWSPPYRLTSYCYLPKNPANFGHQKPTAEERDANETRGIGIRRVWKSVLRVELLVRPAGIFFRPDP